VTAGPAPRAHLPGRAPSRAELDERDRYAQLTAGSMDGVRAIAQTWRNGLAAFITLITTGVIIRGPDTTADLPAAWRTAVTVLIGGGLLLAVLGLWQVLAAEAGTDPRKQTLQDIRAAHGTLTTYQVHLAAKAASSLQRGRRAVAAAILLLLAGIAVTWWAPAAAPSPPASTAVTHRHVTAGGTPQPTGAAGLATLTVHRSRSPIGHSGAPSLWDSGWVPAQAAGRRLAGSPYSRPVALDAIAVKLRRPDQSARTPGLRGAASADARISPPRESATRCHRGHDAGARPLVRSHSAVGSGLQPPGDIRQWRANVDRHHCLAATLAPARRAIAVSDAEVDVRRP